VSGNDQVDGGLPACLCFTNRLCHSTGFVVRTCLTDRGSLRSQAAYHEAFYVATHIGYAISAYNSVQVSESHHELDDNSHEPRFPCRMCRMYTVCILQGSEYHISPPPVLPFP
jgi:hypothetical protein